MRLAEFLHTWHGLQWEKRWSRVLLLGLVLSNLLLAWLASRQETAVVLTPLMLTEPVTVARRQADASYKITWGLFFAQLLGNVTPGNADLILPALDPLLAPALYQPVHDAVAEQLALFAREQLTTRYEPRTAQYDPASDSVSISGVLTTRGATGTAQRSERSYTLRIAVANYRPQLTSLQVYSGSRSPEPEKNL